VLSGSGGPELTRLPREFFGRPSTEVAPELLGCVLWHDSPLGLVAVRLVEVEAYQGSADPASHAYRGQTARNAVMFGPPGFMYVYFTYGMHFCANLVCQPDGQAEAVLLRAGEVIAGLDLAARRRAGEFGRAGSGSRASSDLANGDDVASDQEVRNGRVGGRAMRDRDLARGPARLCQALGIDRGLDGADVCGRGSSMGIGPPQLAELGLANGARVPAAHDSAMPAAEPPEIRTGPRVGVTQAAERPWRYWLAGDNHVSIYRPSKPRSRRKPVADRSSGDGTI
jgi:DNA-3-methyladenine glycosylase